MVKIWKRSILQENPNGAQVTLFGDFEGNFLLTRMDSSEELERSSFLYYGTLLASLWQGKTWRVYF